MEHLVQQYLLRYKYCPFPAIGTLELKDGTAESLIGENRMNGPVPFIIFSQVEKDAEHFVRFIAAKNKIAFEEAMITLNAFCQKLVKMEVFRELSIGTTGKFLVDENGRLEFKQAAIPAEFVPQVNLKRVLRPDAIHQVRVGDTETTNVAMTEYFSEEEEAAKSKWWIFAIVFFVLAATVIGIYTQSPGFNSSFGNNIPVKSTIPGKTYQPVN